MTTKECYEQMGENYNEVMERLGSERILNKFAIKFLSDKSMEELKEGLAEKDGEKAFRAAHTLKGICLNLGFGKLFTVSSDITEKLRGRDTAGCEPLLVEVQKQYDNVVNAVKQLEAETKAD